MTLVRKILFGIGCAVAAIVVGCSAVAYLTPRAKPHDANGKVSSDEDDQDEIDLDTPVKAISPKRDASLVISVQQILSVEPFFQADLRAQVAGVARYIQKDIGDPVRKGELLIAIDVPHLEQELEEKQAFVEQRRSDLKVALAQVENARALADVSHETIDQRKAEELQAEATRDYRRMRYERFVTVAKGGGVQQNIVDEENRDYRAADAAMRGAAAIVRKAMADYREKESGIHIAEADVELKHRLIEVAQKDRDRAKAMLDYAQVRAPFNGVVVKRKIVVGDFVQNASTGQSEPLLTIARTDIVTVVMKVPDNAAPFVTRDTEASIQIDELPGVEIRGKVTRFSPSIQNSDRTMRVEVDLYNDTPEHYERFKTRAVATWLAGMAATSPLTLTPLLAAGREAWSHESRSDRDPLPRMPEIKGSTGARPLLQGMTGYMRLNLRSFQDSYLIPSSAVFTRGGKPYILEVKDGVTKLVPVRVQMNDGRLSKVLVIVQTGSPTQGQPEIVRELTGTEQIILNRQAEIGEGRTVKVTVDNW